ncbi:MAG: VCBS repeat-containing protein, partial [Calditrichota bacterium]
MKTFCATLFFLLTGILAAQSFVEVNTSLEPMRYSALDWGDFDNDGDLDLLASGARFVGQPFNNSDPATIIYENDGSGNFTIYSSSLTGVESGTALWGDYNNDNLLDILICGRLESDLAAAEIWQQDNGVFSKVIDFESLDYPNASWADINNDGWLDIFLSGDADLSPFDVAPVSILYTNDQSGGFIRDDQTVTGLTYGGSEFADYDGDGDFDLFVSGLNLNDG